jgi:hypothetical protein
MVEVTANIRGKIADGQYDLALCAANANVPIVPTLLRWPIRSTLAANWSCSTDSIRQ